MLDPLEIRPFERLMRCVASNIMLESALQTDLNIAIIGEEVASKKIFKFLPQAIQELMLERDPHGNVQVAKMEKKKMLIQMAETDLQKRQQEGKYKGEIRGQSHFFCYKGRCGSPTNFDATYCYALGYVARSLLRI